MPVVTSTNTIMTIRDRRGPLPDPSPRAGQRGVGAIGLYRLLAWMSPAFPVGAFSYSHGLEAAVESGAVQRDRASLQSWVAEVVTRGSGRIDADILRDAYRAAAAGDLAALAVANRRGLAYRATAELALETTAQGDAFLATCRAAWPDPLLDQSAVADGPQPNPPPHAGEGGGGALASLSQAGEGVCYPAAVGAATVCAGIPLDDALIAYLQAIAANLVSAGLRLGIIGQTDGQRILAALEPVVIDAAAAAKSRGPTDFGAATFAVDLASMAHETQYTRLFRS